MSRGSPGSKTGRLRSRSVPPQPLEQTTVAPHGHCCSAAFLDRDGVISANRADHVKSWSEFEFLPGALEGIRLLSQQGRRLVVLTNQAVVNRGLISWAELQAIHQRMVETIAAHGGRIEAVISCPHDARESCVCRKPEPGLLHQAATILGFCLRCAVMIGDHPNDLLAAERAGCRSLLVLSGRTPALPREPLPSGCVAVLPDLLAAARYLVSEPPCPWRGDGHERHRREEGHGPQCATPHGRGVGCFAGLLSTFDSAALASAQNWVATA